MLPDSNGAEASSDALSHGEILSRLSAFATFADLHELTHGITGPERLGIFESLSPELQSAIYANLRTLADRGRP